MRLDGKRVLALVDDEFEDLELWYPVLRLQEEGAAVDLAGKEEKKVYMGKYGVHATADISFASMKPADYDAILVPGGWAPDKLRRYEEVIAAVKHMNNEKKIIGQICHAGWVLISADILDGVTVTSTPGIKDDMKNAGATWHDEEVVTDGHIISSRRPPDLPAYGAALVEAIEKN
ncbi:type 1 glutamine amidotransferase domain-containing protein [Salsuginibacillus kocurii]|uniref:type 1 glutamine amidotransferase domain-containing protein n=1 Tax=Salsuginibacillus kocurii TaxID=427078 RepID=UPI00038032A8|nr:type 1 glutamine amidotransferase domain-containing protein [Salsuginibacillus kocurii]